MILGSTTAMVACSGKSTGLNATKLLRDPNEGHHYSSISFRNEDYMAFRNKLTAFSNKISEAFVNREFEDGKNITVSPLSIAMCLGLAIRCADNNTRQEMLNAFDMDFETFDKFYKVFYNDTVFTSKDSEISLTNSIWIDDDIALIDEGLDALRDDYYCYSFEADFDGANKQTNQAMKKFINEKTKGMLNPDLGIDPSTLFVLMNTLYLRDVWNDEGDDLSYADASFKFTNSNNQVSKKRLLQGYYYDGRTLYAEDYTSFFTNTYEGMRLQFIKPNDGKDIRDIFTKENLSYVMDVNNYTYKDDEKLERYHTRCIFPEYTAETDLDLKEIFIEDLDIRSIFASKTCDFSNIVDDEVYVSDVRHIAKLEVDKKGIKGAAVTYMAVSATSYHGPEEYVDIYEDFLVDKEFGFILSKDNNVLFSGVVTNIDK